VTSSTLDATASAPLVPGSDATAAFRAAYENRYTWAPGFGGYLGRCVWEQDDRRVEGTFTVGADLKAQVEGIDDPEVHKAVASSRPTARTPSPPVTPTPWAPR
jgi:hypothetical protein